MPEITLDNWINVILLPGVATQNTPKPHPNTLE